MHKTPSIGYLTVEAASYSTQAPRNRRRIGLEKHSLLIFALEIFQMSDSKTFTGSCHCGHIRYSIKLPESLLENPKAGRCNCTWCQKPFFTSVHLASPSDSFNLISPTDTSDLGDYKSPNNDKVHRYFCKTCGSHVWREATFELEGKWHDHFAVNLCTIDQPQAGIELNKFKIVYTDGLHDDWMAGTRDEPWIGGCP